MTLARGPILNPGVYWIDAHPTQAPPTFNAWLARSKGLVSVLSTSIHLDEDPPRDWVLFEVLHPAPWTPTDAKAMGFPTVAPKGRATTEEDSRQNELSTPLALDFGSLFSGGSGVLLLAGLLYFASSKKL